MNSQLPQHQTKTELALRVLRERIRSGEYEAGRRLQVEGLSAELGMSPTPIREALRLLQADRLVHYEPHRGVVVARSASDSLPDVYEMRLALEPLATRLAIERMTAKQREDTEQIHERLVEVGKAGGGARLATLNSDWHWAIYGVCGVESMQEFIQRLWNVFPWRTNWALDQRSMDSVIEHERVMDALQAGDAAAGAEAMRQHILAGSKSEQPRRAGWTD
jgi:DNA-binding GntR family transcriptional regulator